jgi:hypothetical protein
VSSGEAALDEVLRSGDPTGAASGADPSCSTHATAAAKSMPWSGQRTPESGVDRR